jgi:hypothetical protein
MPDTIAPVLPLIRPATRTDPGWLRLAAICRSRGVTPEHLRRLAPGVGSEAIAALTPLLAASR